MTTININTFTVGTDSKKYDETKWAEKVAIRYNTNHQSVKVSSHLKIEYVDKIITSMD